MPTKSSIAGGARLKNGLLSRNGLKRLSDGSLGFTREVDQQLSEENADFEGAYREAALRYMNILDGAFCRALHASEFALVHLLLRIREMAPVAWDPWEATKQSIAGVRRLLSSGLSDHATERTLQLWLWGHIVEASEPYEIYINLARIIAGECYNFLRFPPIKVGKKRTRQWTPGEKIEEIKKAGIECGEDKLSNPLDEPWEREFRNAVFHSEFALVGSDIRVGKGRKFEHAEFMTLLNRALASHDALRIIETVYRQSFDRPRLVNVHPEVADWPNEHAWVMVRKRYGAIGLCDAHSKEQINQGRISWMIGKFYPDEQTNRSGGRRNLWFPPRGASPS